MLTGNLLLDALPPGERRALLRHSRPVAIPPKQVLAEAGQRVDRVYFPVSGMVSLISLMEDGSSVEVATYGREGVVGLPEALDPRATPSSRAVGQVSGEALELDAEILRRHLVRGGRLPSLVFSYVAALFNLAAQNASCNRLHQSNQRLARWLLLTCDRTGSEQFDLTHDFMSQMLGARRATVSQGAEELQKAGLIHYARGRISVLDRQGLAKASCECYGLIAARFERLYRT